MKVVCDLETTGFDVWRNDPIAFCFIVMDDNNNMLDGLTVYSNIQNGGWIDKKSLKINNFGLDEIESFQSPPKALFRIKEFLAAFKKSEFDRYEFIYHASGHFDYRFLKTFFTKHSTVHDFWTLFDDNKITSTIKLAKSLPFLKVTDYKLNTLAKHFKIKLNHHEVESDTYATYFIYKKIIGLNSLNLMQT